MSVDIVEASASVEAGAAFQFHVAVSNSTNQACTWSVNGVAGGNATTGTISAAGLFTAPAAVPNPAQVTVKAVAAADTTKSDTATVTITAPPPFTVSPATATVPAGGTRQFTTTPAADVTWSLEGAEGNTAPLGDLSTGGLFTAPLSPPLTGDVTIVATSKTDASVKATAVATITFSDASLHGPYAFTWRATDGGLMMFAAGRLVADGHGGITSGSMTTNRQARSDDPPSEIPFTGTYQVQGDGRTYLTLQTAAQTFQYRLALVNDASARMMSFEAGRNGAGDLERQDPASFAAGLSGSYVFSYDGLGQVFGSATPSGAPAAGAGRLTTTAGGTFADFASDVNINGEWLTGGFGGWFSYPDPSTGRGSLSIDGTAAARHFDFYMLSADEAFLVSTDWFTISAGICATGRLMRQTGGPFSKASLAGNMADLGWGRGAIPEPTPEPYVLPWPAYSGGVIMAGGGGTFPAGMADNNMNGTLSQGMVVSGSYEVAANGRGDLALTAGGTNKAAFYLQAPNTALLVGVDPWGAGISVCVPQPGTGSFTQASLNGRYALALTGTLASAGTDVTGAILLNGLGDLAGVIDINALGVLTQNASASGAYILSENGRGTMTVQTSTRTWTMTMYAVDAGKILLMGTSAPFSGTLTRQF